MIQYEITHVSKIGSAPKLDGETIEQKIERIISNKEPIEDGAPEIFTERKDGVVAAYNIRTDRWEIATEAMNKVHMSEIARRDNVGKAKMEVVDDKKATGTDDSTAGSGEKSGSQETG